MIKALVEFFLYFVASFIIGIILFVYFFTTIPEDPSQISTLMEILSE